MSKVYSKIQVQYLTHQRFVYAAQIHERVAEHFCPVLFFDKLEPNCCGLRFEAFLKHTGQAPFYIYWARGVIPG
jgi:hypothetical protein